LLRLVSTEDFILLFSIISCHLKYFKIVHKTTYKMHDSILEFYNTEFYFILLVVYGMK
jgi:hypothetical protein